MRLTEMVDQFKGNLKMEDYLSASNVIGFEPLITAEEAAALLSLHCNTVLLWARQGRIPCHRLGRRVAFRASQLNAWLEGQYTCPAVRAALTLESEAAA